MEITSTPSPVLGHKQTSAKKFGGSNDLWAAARNGPIQDVDLALTHLKKFNGNIDARSVLGSTALHIAVWRNHIPIVRRLLASGANPDARDGESGWSSLHRALHFGHLAVAGVLIEAGASLVIEDTKGRVPIDLISGPLNRAIANPLNSGLTEVYSWGNGANYQLGIGTAGIQRIPCRLDALQTLDVKQVAAAKFHSAAVTASGDVYTWGFGRGGRLGHPDFDIHSGQVAVIMPRQVTTGLGKKVKGIAVAKHHTVICTDGGEVFTWGSNRDGRLGYPSVDTQATPRKVGTLKVRVGAVAAANKHSAVLTESGEVYTWGCNSEGQLGYGTSNSASNFTPRLIDYLKGRPMVAISTAKYHTVVLGAEGEVMTWGYKMVTPRRVVFARDTRKKGPHPLKYHRMDHRRLHVIAIAAGMTHSTVVTEDGAIFYWMSADTQLRPYQLSAMSGHQAVAVAAGKYRTAVATITGNVYAWDGEGSKADVRPAPIRVHGAKHVTRLSVGETHSLAVSSLYAPTYSSKPVNEAPVVPNATREEEEFADEDAEVDEECGTVGTAAPNRVEGVSSLKDLCQKVVTESIVEPKNALQLLEFADSLGADHLKRYCEDLVLRNLDYILTISSSTYGQLPAALLAELEKVFDLSSNEPWSQRLLPTPTATLPVVIDSEEEDIDTCGDSRLRNFRVASGELDGEKAPCEGFLLSGDSRGEDAVGKQLRAVRKKLQQIEALELKQLKGHELDSQQLAKLVTKPELEISLSLLESGVLPPVVPGPRISSSSPVEKEIKPSPREGETTATSKHGGRTGRRKGKGAAGRGQSVEPPAAVKSNDANQVEDFDLQETLQQIALLEATEEPSSWTQNMSEPVTPQRPSPPSVGFKEISGFSAAGLAASSDSWTNSQTPKSSSSSKKKAKKGGLSMFLSGALEAPPKPLPPSPPPVPKVEGPAWGGVHLPKGSASLRDIQTQQRVQVIQPKLAAVGPMETSPSPKPSPAGKPLNGEKATVTGFSPQEMVTKKVISVGKSVVSSPNPILEKGEGSGSKTRIPPAVLSSGKTSSSTGRVNLVRSEIASESAVSEKDGNVLRVPLSEFVRSSAPIAVAAAKQSQGLHPENSPPAWAGRSPGTSAPLLRDIQVQQVKQHKAQQRPIASRGSPQLSSSLSLMVSAPGSSSQIFDGHAPPSTETPNRWYKPEVANPSPIRNIQKEEEAMKDLRRLYKSVKIVRPTDS